MTNTDIFNLHINVDGEYDVELFYFLLESHVWCHSYYVDYEWCQPSKLEMILQTVRCTIQEWYPMLGCCFTDIFHLHINVDGEYDIELYIFLLLLEYHVWLVPLKCRLWMMPTFKIRIDTSNSKIYYVRMVSYAGMLFYRCIQSSYQCRWWVWYGITIYFSTRISRMVPLKCRLYHVRIVSYTGMLFYWYIKYNIALTSL